MKNLLNKLKKCFLKFLPIFGFFIFLSFGFKFHGQLNYEELNYKLKIESFRCFLSFKFSTLLVNTAVACFTVKTSGKVKLSWTCKFTFDFCFRSADFDQCQEINDELNFIISATEELNNTLSYVPFFVQIVSAKYSTLIDNEVNEDSKSKENEIKIFIIQKREIRQILCLPSSCTFEDLVQVLSYVPLTPEAPELMKNTDLSEIRILYQNYKFYADPNFTIIV